MNKTNIGICKKHNIKYQTGEYWGGYPDLTCADCCNEQAVRDMINLQCSPQLYEWLRKHYLDIKFVFNDEQEWKRHFSNYKKRYRRKWKG